MKNVTAYSISDQRNLKLMVMLNRALQSIHRLEYPVIKAAGLSMSQFGVLEFLFHRGPHTIGDILKKTLATGGNMTVIITNLQKLGLIEKSIGAEDKRISKISITEKGESILKEVFPQHIRNLKDLLQDVEEHEKDNLIDLLRKLGQSAHERGIKNDLSVKTDIKKR